MKKTTYGCNLCQLNKPVEQLFGIHFIGRVRDGSGVDWVLRDASDCETHICTACVAEIRSEPRFTGLDAKQDEAA
jgi:hypothetical protein